MRESRYIKVVYGEDSTKITWECDLPGYHSEPIATINRDDDPAVAALKAIRGMGMTVAPGDTPVKIVEE